MRIRAHWSRSALVVLAVLVGLVPTIGQAAAADPGPDGVEDRPPMLVQPFPDVPGVDLEALGYEGAPLDRGAIDQLLAELPDDPSERVAEIVVRLELVPPTLEGLLEALDVLTAASNRLDAAAATLADAASVAAQREAAARVRTEAARQRVEARETALLQHRDAMAEVAVAAYVSPPDADVLASVLGGAATTTDDLAAGVLFSAKADHDGQVRDDIEVSRAVALEKLDQDLASEEAAAASAARTRGEAAEMAERAAVHRVALEAVRAPLDEMRDLEANLREDLDRTIEEAWGAVGQLAGIDVSKVEVVVVEGITVHVAVAPRLQALLSAAHAAGVPLGGWGHRSIDQQVALRRAHCGPTPEDVYLKPAGACSPPTARPGSSLHERGLAIDFHLAGASISTRESPGYQWLAENAALFGFYNLPSEPWHWSVNGQ